MTATPERVAVDLVAWGLVAGASCALLWAHGWWLAVPLVAYGLAWVSHRAAIHAAIEYGVALQVLLDLNRHLIDATFEDDVSALTRQRHEHLTTIALRDPDAR